MTKDRKIQREFIAKGLAARDKAKNTGRYVSKDTKGEVMDVMGSILDMVQSRQQVSLLRQEE